MILKKVTKLNYSLRIKDYVFTCMMAMLSRIQACRDEARSLKEASFFWPSASKRGCPEGGSGKTSYN